MENEIWKDIKGFEGLYQASNIGRVKSLPRNTTNGKLLKQTSRSNYLCVTLCKEGNEKLYNVHKLVWEAFNGTVPEGMEINHINEIKTDNRLENLNLLSHKDNMNWGTRKEKLSTVMKNRKDESKPVIQFDLNGKFIKEWPSVMEIKRVLLFAQGNVSNCCNNKRKTAYGYIWKFKEDC